MNFGSRRTILGVVGTAAAWSLAVVMVSGQAAPCLEVEAPAVERAHELVALDLAEHREVGVAVRASALDDPVAELDVGFDLGRWIEPPQRLGLGPPHALDRQRLEEVVEVLVELAVAPRPETARQEQRVAPVDRPAGHDRLDEVAGDLEPE